MMARGQPRDATWPAFLRRLGPRQHAALEAFYVGEQYAVGISRRVIDRLVALGLLVPEVEHHRDVLGSFTVTRYAMPLEVHLHYTFYLAAQADEEDL